ncbi:MAG: DUF4360 domain-containing protein [Oligoflexia bacterium]|nr:DUF4360 domain-containing protein [Oligoflexia bacterium]
MQQKKIYKLFFLFALFSFSALALAKSTTTEISRAKIEQPMISGSCKLLGKNKVLISKDRDSFSIQFDNFGFDNSNSNSNTSNKSKRINCTVAMPVVVSKNINVSLPSQISWHFDSNLGSNDEIIFKSEYFFAGETATNETIVEKLLSNESGKITLTNNLSANVKTKAKTKIEHNINDCGKSKIFRINLSLMLKKLETKHGFIKLKMATAKTKDAIKFISHHCNQ